MRQERAIGTAARSIRLANAILLSLAVLLTYVIYVVSPVSTSTDSAWTFHIAASMLRQHNIDLDEYRQLMDLKVDYRLREIQGHIFSYYPIATPLLVTPAVWLINQAYPLIYPYDFYTYLDEHAPDSRTARLEKLIASGIAALSAAFIYLIARRELSVTLSLLTVLVFAFSTSMWSTASRALWQHGPSVLFLSAALYLLLQEPRRRLIVLTLGVLLGFSYLIRPTNSLAVAFVGLYLLLNERTRLWLYVAGVAVVLIPYIAFNFSTYGNVLPPYSYQLFERLATPPVFAEGLAGTLISPARGLFIFSPVFLFSIYGALLRLRGKLRLSYLDSYLAAVVVAHWLITSLFEDWGGAWSIGPRYFVDVIPVLIYFLIAVFKGSSLSIPIVRYAFLASVLVGCLIQLHCSTSIDPFMWNGKPQALVDAPQRKWDWGDLQFLRGLCRGDPLEGRAPACWFDANG